MAASSNWLPRFAAAVTFASFAAGSSTAPSATTGEIIQVWKVGSPHTGKTPPATVPAVLRRESVSHGVRLSVRAFPAKGFAALFADAVTRGAAPDVVVFDNFGVMQGITTALGTFEGIGEDPAVRKHLIRVTGAFDALLGPERGWTYLFALSANHSAARRLALGPPSCGSGSVGAKFQGQLAEIVPKLATAYLEEDVVTLQAHSDPDRLSTVRQSGEKLEVGTARPCRVWGNDRLAIASVGASYVAESTVGHARVLLVLRKGSSRWLLLVAARDPISNSTFMNDVESMSALLVGDDRLQALPIPATPLSPPVGQPLRAARGERFGMFTWRSGPSADIVAEIAEFAYKDDARLFVRRPAPPGSLGQLSDGRLWTTRGMWSWRVWSISRSGDIAFSEVWTFRH